jgi:malonate decarboxylase gamma subunit
MKWQTLATRLFPEGHDIAQDGDFLTGTGRCGPYTITVLGTTNHAEVGIEITLAMAGAVLRTVRRHPGRAILFLTDTQGQRLRHRDELLGINSYMAHLGKCIQVARELGHSIIGLVFDQALSGGFIASAMGADICAALPGAEIRVMSLSAMARVTRIPEERLRELSLSSPVFAPGAGNYVRMGAIEPLWDGSLARRLQEAVSRADKRDRRSRLGFDRGGRALAHSVAQRVASDG